MSSKRDEFCTHLHRSVVSVALFIIREEKIQRLIILHALLYHTFA